MASVHSVSVMDAKGKPVSLEAYAGKVLLIVNVASKCGFTPQYEGLEALYKKFGPNKFVVLGFPCNQFGGQEPGTDAEIQTFCSTEYSVTFPVMSKVEVNGANTHPLYKILKEQAAGILSTEAIKWNFTKFLIDKDGKVVQRFAPQDKPESLEKDILALLG